MHRYLAEPEQVYAERVAGHATIYLDTNAWSDLGKASSAAAREALELATTAHSARRAIFPLANASITEFLKRAKSPEAIRQAEIMEVLSSGVTLRGGQHIRDLEVLCAFEFMSGGQPSRPIDKVFTVIPCYVGDGRIQFPEGWTETAADEFMEKLRQQGNPGARWLQDHMRTPEFLKMHLVTDEKWVREITRKRHEAIVWATDKSGRLNASKLRLEEHTFVLKKYILGNLPRLVGRAGMESMVEQLDQVVNKPGSTALGLVVSTMPSTSLSCEMNVQRVLLRTRKTQKQDFYDHEHAVFGVPYADAFVTSDDGLLDILRRARAASTYDSQLVRGMGGLLGYLKRLLAA